jgi:uncharacterized phage protein (TIGR01671 family)
MNKKFRVWDIQDKSFYSLEYLREFKVSISFDGQTIDQDFWGGTKTIGEDVIVQHYIGADDKNKNPIYEGDVVAWTFHSGGKEIFQVIWDDFYCGFAFALKDGRGLNHTGFKLLNSPHGNENYEVIGNIFENPELLK